MSSKEFTTSVEHIVACYMVKYNRLSRLVQYAFEGSTDECVNLYIDLYGLYKTILSRSFRTDTSDYMAIVPSIVNMCAHYRQFFRMAHVDSKIFLISSYNTPDISRKMVAGYNKLMMDKLQNPALLEMLEFNLGLLEILCPYLRDIHFIKTDFESTVLIDQIIQKEFAESGKMDPSLIITSDILPAQLCVKYDSVGLIRAKKYKGEDLSSIIVPQKFGLEKFLKSFNDVVYADARTSLSESTKEHVIPPNFVLLLALNGFTQRSIKTLMNAGAATKLINTVAGSTPMNMMSLYVTEEAMSNGKSQLSRYPQQILEARYKVLDATSMDYFFKESIEAVNLNYENLIDPGAVQMINSQYFSTNPIDVFRL